MAAGLKNFNPQDGTGLLAQSAHEGHLTISQGILEKATTDGDGSIYRLRVPSNAVLYDLYSDNDALTGCTDVDAGLYYIDTLNNSGAVIDADCFADGVSFASASTGKSLVGQIDKANRLKPVWEIAGLTEDPKGELDIALTLNTAGSAAGTVRLVAEFIAN